MSFLERPISPPPRKRAREATDDQPVSAKKLNKGRGESTNTDDGGIEIVRSPIRLYTVTDLPDSENVDTVTLKEILSPPSTLDEVWSFNFMTNMSWFRDHIGEQDKDRVKIRVVHGYWRREDESRKVMEEGIWGPNVKLISAYLPDTFGTHHSKVIVVFRTDDTAQVLVQTGDSFRRVTR